MNSPTNDTNSSSPASRPPSILADTTNQPMQNYDGTEMRDANSKIVYRSQFLSTHPLRGDCCEKPGFGGKKFTYVTGDGVIRTMNAIFGHGGWSSQIVSERCIQNEKDDRGRWWIGYLVTVRITLINGSSHEDCGSGEGINPSKIQAHDKALKSAVTDAMKRAARHFGERLGNALYVKGNGIRTAPRTNREALEQLERNDQLNLFGDQVALRDRCKTEEVQKDGLMSNGNAILAGINQPPTPVPVVSTATARQVIPYNSAAAMPTHNHPVASIAAPRQQSACNTAAPIPTNHYASNKPAAASVTVQTTYNSAISIQQNQYAVNKPYVAPPAAVAQNQYSTSGNQNPHVNNVYNTAKMPPPQESRGVSPETASGSVVHDASKRSLTNVAVRNNLGNNTTSADDSNKRQKMNPYSNNRLSC